MPTVKRLQHTSVPMPPGGNDQARAFYGQALGLREIPKPSTLSNNLVWFAANDDGDEVHVFQQDDAGPHSAAQHLCLEVDDLEAFRSRLTDHGFAPYDTDPIINRPRLMVRDPFGNLIELSEIHGQYT